MLKYIRFLCFLPFGSSAFAMESEPFSPQPAASRLSTPAPLGIGTSAFSAIDPQLATAIALSLALPRISFSSAAPLPPPAPGPALVAAPPTAPGGPIPSLVVPGAYSRILPDDEGEDTFGADEANRLYAERRSLQARPLPARAAALPAPTPAPVLSTPAQASSSSSSDGSSWHIQGSPLRQLYKFSCDGKELNIVQKKGANKFSMRAYDKNPNWLQKKPGFFAERLMLLGLPTREHDQYVALEIPDRSATGGRRVYVGQIELARALAQSKGQAAIYKFRRQFLILPRNLSGWGEKPKKNVDVLVYDRLFTVEVGSKRHLELAEIVESQQAATNTDYFLELTQPPLPPPPPRDMLAEIRSTQSEAAVLARAAALSAQIRKQNQPFYTWQNQEQIHRTLVSRPGKSDASPIRLRELSRSNAMSARQFIGMRATQKERLTPEGVLALIANGHAILTKGLVRQGAAILGGVIRSHSTAPGFSTATYVTNPDEEMSKFASWLASALKETEAGRYEPIRLASEAYQQLLTIHPFGAGNGRISRLMRDYVLQRYGLPPATAPKCWLAQFASRQENPSTTDALQNTIDGVLAAWGQRVEESDLDKLARKRSLEFLGLANKHSLKILDLANETVADLALIKARIRKEKLAQLERRRDRVEYTSREFTLDYGLALSSFRDWPRGPELYNFLEEVNDLLRPPGGVRSAHEYRFDASGSLRAQMAELSAWIDARVVATNRDEHNPIYLAAEAYQRFMAIRPFVNGNEGSAECLLNLILTRFGLPDVELPRDFAPKNAEAVVVQLLELIRGGN